ncbi:hypothetical protein AB0B45_46075 [Nonomuraea sp. NPDC049152]|uniref:hypothetical protein n=1 Tax=Nonomuraea sp. NPDC049152 TaxID=3154350 RepID=UPI0033DC3F85
MTQYGDVQLSDVQVQAIQEDLQGQLMWRVSRLDELRALAESVDNGDGSLQGVLADLAATERSIAEIHEGRSTGAAPCSGPSRVPHKTATQGSFGGPGRARPGRAGVRCGRLFLMNYNFTPKP